MTTPSMEDYLEKIYSLIEQKGYARVVDVSIALNVTPPSVTRMMQKLADNNLGVYEKYRGFVLTLKGKQIAKDLNEKHKLLENFLRLIGVHETNIYEEVERVEHHISKRTAFCISNLINFFEENPHIKEAYVKYLKQLKKD